LSRDIPDDDPRKWDYTEHARAKHAIQWTYLGAWLAILGSRHRTLLLFDGFAGRGRYNDGQDGSPILFWKRAKEAVEQGRPREVRIRCNELNRNNFQNLQDEVAKLSFPGVTISCQRAKFEDAADEAAALLEQQGRSVPPSFWTADPFGFAGVPLGTIRRIMSLDRAEVLITFMVRDMRRFLDQDNFEAPLTEFFGGDAWRDCIDRREAEEREQCLLLRYSELVRSGGVAKYATPFRVFEDERRQTLYYLVHLSNHPLGMRQMKKAMIKESPDMTFWPVTVRPPDQLALDVGEQPPFPRLQRHLVETYGGQRLQFGKLLDIDYPVGFWLEPEYRAAIKALNSERKVVIERSRKTKTGREPSGLQEDDVVLFPLEQMQFG
jgi:three-Cys-motif partner protein